MTRYGVPGTDPKPSRLELAMLCYDLTHLPIVTAFKERRTPADRAISSSIATNSARGETDGDTAAG